MSRKRRPLSETSRRREIFDLTLVELVVTNEQKIFHSPAVEHILDRATLLLRAGDGQANIRRGVFVCHARNVLLPQE